jgi:hypothetical protein
VGGGEGKRAEVVAEEERAWRYGQRFFTTTAVRKQLVCNIR